MGLTLEEFSSAVGSDGPVTIHGLDTRGGPVADVRAVTAPSGVEWVQPAEMTIKCGAATPVDDVDAALAEHGQQVAIPSGGTIGGALAVGRSGIRRLGYGAMRDTLLQAPQTDIRYSKQILDKRHIRELAHEHFTLCQSF